MPKYTGFILIILLFILFLFIPSFAADEITITTYYPSPYGSYRELTTDSNTYLAISSGSVGIGTTTPGAFKLYVNGNTHIQGNLSKTGGSFDIMHPDPAKEKDGWRLRHSFVESPTRGDNLYRWIAEVENKEAVIILPSYFKYLNENIQAWVSAKGHFGRAYAEVDSAINKLMIKADTDGPYHVLVIGTRKDRHVVNFDLLGIEYQQK